ncbi:hypothetical protein [Comamonas sp. lk]|uniref:hypothetical protein n=1 Tax=Comamonas sp. lk TaxID=2201272 RepID=UPI000EAFD619|nr:hypothetical protein [Comamonas sp. lk]
MNSTPRIPPRFVPTLTEVIDAERESAVAEQDAARAKEMPLREPAPQPELAPDTLGALAVPKQAAAFHSPWLADGLYAKRGAVALPKELPPLPEALPPQPSFSPAEVIEAASQEPAAEAQVETAALVQAEPHALDISNLAELGSEPVREHESAPPQATGLPSPQQPQQGLVANALASAVSEEDLVHRLMQRVDLVLEQRLREAIAQVVQEQTRTMVLRLRQEVETVVRQSVYEATEGELSKQVSLKSEQGTESRH